jgi:hypothetical protein
MRQFARMLSVMLLGFLLYSTPILARAQFATPVPANSASVTDKSFDNEVVIKTDGNGLWICAWVYQSQNLNNLYGNDPVTGEGGAVPYYNEDIYVSRSTDNGRHWSTMTPIKANLDDKVDDLEPDLATDGLGHWMVVWRSRDTLGGTIGYDADILMSYSADNGITWSAPAPVNNNAATDLGGDMPSYDADNDDCYPRVYADNQGHWLVTWQTYTASWTTSARLAISSDAGAHWSNPITLQSRTEGTIGGLQRPILSRDNQGRWHAIWASRTNSSSDYDLYTSISSDNGATWSSPALLIASMASDSMDDSSPSIDTDGQGHYVLIWNSSGGTLGSNTAIMFSRSDNNWATWSSPAPINTDELSNDTLMDYWPLVTYDGKGNYITAWSSATRMGSDFDEFFSVLGPGANAWTKPFPVNSWAASDTSSDVGPGLASDRQGHWMVVWPSTFHYSGNDPNSDLDLYTAFCAATPPVNPTVAATPGSLDFRKSTGLAVDVTRHDPPTSQIVNLTNVGLADLVVNSVSFSGTHAKDYSVAPTPIMPLTLKPFETQSLNVQFAPQEQDLTWAMNATMEIDCNNPVQPKAGIPVIGDAVPVQLSKFSIE